MNATDYYAWNKLDRNDWRDEMPSRCMRCSRKFGWHPDYYRWPEIHEILSRAQAPNNWAFRANYLLLCNPCHASIGELSHAEQLGIKMVRDPTHYDLQLWLERRNPAAMQYVTQEEVIESLKRRSA